MAEIVNHWITVHGPTLRGYGPFGGPPCHPVSSPDDAQIGEDGTLTIVIKPRTTEKGVLVEKTVRYRPGAWTHVTTSTTTKERP
jgi:hypothetical protein